MGLSFRKSVQIMPGVKLNISKSGLSVSTGIKGLHASINTKGQVRGTASIPGTGIRYTKSKKLTDLIPGAKEREEEKKAAEKAAKAEAKAKAKAEADAIKAEEKAKAKAEADAAKAEEKAAKLKKGDLSKEIMSIYAFADKSVEWITIKNSSSNIGYENWEYLKERAAKVLDGDIDTYLEIISDVNPFDELIELGSEFSCGTDNPMKMYVECKLDADKIKEAYKEDKDIYEDYVAGIAIKSARDIFALLPLWQVEVSAVEGDKTVLNAKFERDSFELLNFDKIDASDTVRKLGGIIAV